VCHEMNIFFLKVLKFETALFEWALGSWFSQFLVVFLICTLRIIGIPDPDTEHTVRSQKADAEILQDLREE
jgi:hypothetical protein